MYRVFGLAALQTVVSLGLGMIAFVLFGTWVALGLIVSISAYLQFRYIQRQRSVARAEQDSDPKVRYCRTRGSIK